MSEYKPTVENLSDPYVLQLIMALAKQGDEIEIFTTDGRLFSESGAFCRNIHVFREKRDPAQVGQK